MGSIDYGTPPVFLLTNDKKASSEPRTAWGRNLAAKCMPRTVLLCRPQNLRRVAVIGVPNETMGEAVKALVMARDPAHPPTAEALDAFARERLAGFKCPRSYDVVADLGRNAMGKVNKRELRRPFWPTDRTIGG